MKIVKKGFLGNSFLYIFFHNFFCPIKDERSTRKTLSILIKKYIIVDFYSVPYIKGIYIRRSRKQNTLNI